MLTSEDLLSANGGSGAEGRSEGPRRSRRCEARVSVKKASTSRPCSLRVVAGEDALHEAAALFTPRAEGRLPVHDGVPDTALTEVVGGLDAQRQLHLPISDNYTSPSVSDGSRR